MNICGAVILYCSIEPGHLNVTPDPVTRSRAVMCNTTLQSPYQPLTMA